MKNSMFDNLKAVVANTRTEDIKMIDIAELHESADNFFVVENIEQFAQTILGQGGVKDNLVVRPLETGGYEIISGHRRKAAVQYLLDKGENIARVLPCLVQNYADEDEKMLDLVLMNVSSRQISDQELWKCYETIDKILKDKKEKGEYFGRIRDDIATTLGISASQVGKMQNVEKNAIEPVKEAVAKGELSISTANEIAKLNKEEQSQITDLSKVQPKNLKNKAVVTSNKDKNNNKKGGSSVKEHIATSNNEESEKSDDIIIHFDTADDDTNNNDKTEVIVTRNTVSKTEEDLSNWESAIKGYVLFAAEAAAFSEEQINSLLGGMMKALSNFSKDEAENKYNNR